MHEAGNLFWRASLLQSGITGSCLLGQVLGKLGVPNA
jgi:hypothetical protein